jgi:hypothetical protein
MVTDAARDLLARVAETACHQAGAEMPGIIVRLDSQRIAEREISVADSAGTWWPTGLLDRCRALAKDDRRYSFVHRIPRSWFFGASLVDALGTALHGVGSSQAATAAGLMNTFVTAFDGICDEVPELLPAVLGPVQELVARFPEPGGPGVMSDNPVAQLAWTSAVSFASIVHDAVRAARPEIRSALDLAIRRAFEAQLASLSWLRRAGTTPGPRSADPRSEVSAGPFRVAVLLPLLFSPGITASLTDLDALAVALGRHFGWIDDLVDLESDVRFRQPNAIGDMIGLSHSDGLVAITADDPRTLKIINESRLRMLAVQDEMMRLGIAGDGFLQMLTLNTLMWLGVPLS